MGNRAVPGLLLPAGDDGCCPERAPPAIVPPARCYHIHHEWQIAQPRQFLFDLTVSLAISIPQLIIRYRRAPLSPLCPSRASISTYWHLLLRLPSDSFDELTHGHLFAPRRTARPRPVSADWGHWAGVSVSRLSPIPWLLYHSGERR